MLIRALLLSCGLGLVLSAPAFSAEERKPASAPAASVPDAKREADAVKPAVPPPANGHAKDAAKEGPKDTGKDASKEVGKDAAKDAAKEPQKPSPHIALILPTESKSFGKVADAVKSGFVAAALADGKEAPPYRVYATADDTTALAKEIRRATSDGAILLAAGLTRDGANMLAREAGYLPALALNAPAANDSELPERFFHVSLSLDSEARLLAKKIGDEGLKRIAIASSASPLAKRVQDTFEKEWTRRGGEVAARLALTGALEEGAKLATAFEKANADSAIVFADKKIARGARPFFPQGLPVYATSYTIDPRADAVENLDLDGVRFLEMPWFVEADHPAVMAYAKPTEPMPIDLERLYALGIDAWRLANALVKAEKLARFPPLDGVTGKITLDGKQFVRTLTAAELRDGRIAARGGVTE
ncbi:MAG: penicillin-binding protein activator [Betaproteobacteria bacterium]|nr:penicillin-binding protein activator [Betaproteobacteria bacterium]